MVAVVPDGTPERASDRSDAARRATAVTAFTVFALQSVRISETVERSLDAVLDAVAARAGVVLRVTGPTQAVVMHSGGTARCQPGEELEVKPLVLDAGICYEPPSACRAEAGTAPDATGLSVLVAVEGMPWGRLVVRDSARRTFSEADAEAARTIADVLGAAVQRARREDRRSELAALGRFALRSRDMFPTIERSVETVSRVLGTPLGAVLRVAAHRSSTLLIVHAIGAEGVTAGFRYEVDPQLAEALRTTGELVVEDARTDARFVAPLLPGEAVAAACIASALVVEGRTWGWLVTADTMPRRFTDEEVEFVRSTAAVLADALQRKRREWAQAGAALLSAAQQKYPAGPTTEVALLNPQGVIVWVNRAWEDFARDNGGDPALTGVGESYLDRCDGAGDPLSTEVAAAVRAALAGDLPAPMLIEVPCHAPNSERWFDLLISTRLDEDGNRIGATVTLSPSDR
jgi:GAF domain-containing protein